MKNCDCRGNRTCTFAVIVSAFAIHHYAKEIEFNVANVNEKLLEKITLNWQRNRENSPLNELRFCYRDVIWGKNKNKPYAKICYVKWLS